MQLVWFRRDLRVEDNTALIEATRTGEPVIAVYIATPRTWQSHDLAPIQADLIFRRLSCLQRDLAMLNIELLYMQVDTFSDSADALQSLAVSLDATHIHLNREYEWNESQRDSRLQSSLSSTSIELLCHHDKCLFAPGSVVNKQQQYFKVFTPFKRAYLARLSGQALMVSKPTVVRKTDGLNQHELRFSPECCFDYPRKSSQSYQAETKAIRQLLRDFCTDSVDDYHQQRDFPALYGTSKISPYLAIGALSIRQCLARLFYGQQPPMSAGREIWQSELVWRDFYQHLIHFEPKLSKGHNFVSWADNIHWHHDPDKLAAWQQGKTGYPIVDAAMRQLNNTGWMHNRLRMIVASFLTKHLHIHWRHGERYFMANLIDGDYPANNGGWQWSASTGCDAQPYFRIFNPMTQSEKFDAKGEFIRHWLPELADVPDKFIHQPWLWANVSSLSYPSPIVDHKTERALTLQMFKQAKDS